STTSTYSTPNSKTGRTTTTTTAHTVDSTARPLMRQHPAAEHPHPDTGYSIGCGQLSRQRSSLTFRQKYPQMADKPARGHRVFSPLPLKSCGGHPELLALLATHSESNEGNL